ncbi:hypothetical protein [Kitasatospora sp. GAS204B]|uniref:hypothetical protein n=1 Tax=unclassified Kitasatospora TaxID=2633591 RepID=UPI002474617D|nr:hypothetical protein [Kitasatospora sp. GAS204B]MDH6119581.1 hypothetical protein [Kitasatospora sp. GAS204B]
MRPSTEDALIIAALAICFALAIAGVALGVVTSLRLTRPGEDTTTPPGPPPATS